MLFSHVCNLRGGEHETKLKREDEGEKGTKKEPRERPHPHSLGSEGWGGEHQRDPHPLPRGKGRYGWDRHYYGERIGGREMGEKKKQNGLCTMKTGRTRDARVVMNSPV